MLYKVLVLVKVKWCYLVLSGRDSKVVHTLLGGDSSKRPGPQGLGRYLEWSGTAHWGEWGDGRNVGSGR